MDADLKERWLEALRSGRYQQGTGSLRTTYGYCCLGVLADVIDPDRWKIAPFSVVYTWGSNHNFLHSDGGGLHMVTQRRLAKINDEADDFGPSIDFIERKL